MAKINKSLPNEKKCRKENNVKCVWRDFRNN